MVPLKKWVKKTVKRDGLQMKGKGSEERDGERWKMEVGLNRKE